MLKRTLILSLIAILALPVNAGAATWMAMSMADGDEFAPTLDSSADLHAGHQHAMNMGNNQSSDSAAQQKHDQHDAEDCDEHCLFCSSHCSSSGIASTATDFDSQRNLQACVVTGFKLTREYLLYRSPIHA